MRFLPIALITQRRSRRHYLALDSPARYQFWVCENLGDRQEQINYFSAEAVESLASLPEDSFALLNVVILLQQLERSPTLELSTLPLVGLPDRILTSFADRPGLMTKREVRLIVLGELALQPNQVVWDIGAGTGSVAVEVARLCPTSQVYAIEKTAMGITLIEQNSQRLQLANVHPLYGTAPEILAKLPIPDRVFIGGSGGNLLAILEVCAQKMTDNGLIVMALATLEHLNLGLTWLRDRLALPSSTATDFSFCSRR